MNAKMCFMDWFYVQHGRSVYIPESDKPTFSPMTAGIENVFLAHNTPRRQQMPFGVKITPESPLLTDLWLVADRPWERSCAWVTVIPENDLLRCWYVARLNPPDASRAESDAKANERFAKPEVQYVLCYAESSDGVHWTKPDLGLYSHNGSTANNITCPYGKETAVFRDENAPQAERYKCFDFAKLPNFSEDQTIYEQSGLYPLVSPDGLNWKRGVAPVIRYFCDTQNILTWDPYLKKYVGYFRGHFFAGLNLEAGITGRNRDFNYGGRAIARAETEDFHQWPMPQVILTPGPMEGPATDYYSNGFTWHPDDPMLRLMFSSIYHRDRDSVEVRLAVSRDGSAFNWLSYDPIIQSGPAGSEMWGGCYPGPNLLYLPDGRLALPLRVTSGAHNEHNKLLSGGGYRWATWSPGRLAGIEAQGGRGEFFTMPQTFTGAQVEINARTGSGGYIFSELWAKTPSGTAEPLPGYTFADSVPFRGNQFSAPCLWRGKNDLSELQGRDLIVRFNLSDAKLFTLQFA